MAYAQLWEPFCSFSAAMCFLVSMMIGFDSMGKDNTFSNHRCFLLNSIIDCPVALRKKRQR